MDTLVATDEEPLPLNLDLCIADSLRQNLSGIRIVKGISEFRRKTALSRALSGTRPLTQDLFRERLTSISNAADCIENLPMLLYSWENNPSLVMYQSIHGLNPQLEYDAYVSMVKSYIKRGVSLSGKQVPPNYCPKVLIVQINNLYSPLVGDAMESSLNILLGLYALFSRAPYLQFYLPSKTPILPGSGIYEFLHENFYRVMKDAGLPGESWASIAKRLLNVSSDFESIVEKTVELITPEP